jgi:hypothetical protein
VLKLNGGLGTSMGLEKAKSLLEVPPLCPGLAGPVAPACGAKPAAAAPAAPDWAKRPAHAPPAPPPAARAPAPAG